MQTQTEWMGGKRFSGVMKNKYRYITDPDGSRYIEVQLQREDLIMKCDVEHLPIVEERIWTGNKPKDKHTYYVTSRSSVKRDQEYCLFHRRIFPDIPEIDHINREGLDNRSINIRDGSNGYNPNNKKMLKNNTSGTTGVYLEGKDGPKPRYKAQWNDINGKKCSKSFACNKYPDAYDKAVQWRDEKHREKMDALAVQNA